MELTPRGKDRKFCNDSFLYTVCPLVVLKLKMAFLLMIFNFMIGKNPFFLFGLVVNTNGNRRKLLPAVVNYTLSLFRNIEKIHLLLQFIWVDNLHNLNPLKSTPPNSFNSAWPMTIETEALESQSHNLANSNSLTFINFFLNDCWQAGYLRFKKKKSKLVPYSCGKERAVAHGRRKKFLFYPYLRDWL